MNMNPSMHAGCNSSTNMCSEDEDVLYLFPPNHSSYTVIHGLGNGDSSLHYNITPNDFANSTFQKLIEEVNFQEMKQAGGLVPRLVAVQGIFMDEFGLQPIYRHPTDSDLDTEPMSPTVLVIKDRLEALLDGQKLNHVLIQLYRHGKDHINEHSDKTLDILRGTNIINFSVGSCRTFQLKRKKDSSYYYDNNEPPIQSVQKIVLPNNSAFVCSWNTNAQFVHGIKPDKRDDSLKHMNELTYSGMRISLTFRSIATYRYTIPSSIEGKSIDLLFGQGAKIKDLLAIKTFNFMAIEPMNDEYKREESLRLLSAFTHENRNSNFDWDKYYGEGFDIVKLESLE